MQTRVMIGKYPVLKPIAVGAQGEVFLVRHPDPVLSKKLFAAKVLLRRSDEETIDQFGPGNVRFRAEAETLAALRHDALISVVDFGETDAGEPFFVMEHVDGGTLADAIEGGRQFSVIESLDIVIGALEGLQAAHARGIV